MWISLKTILFLRNYIKNLVFKFCFFNYLTTIKSGKSCTVIFQNNKKLWPFCHKRPYNWKSQLHIKHVFHMGHTYIANGILCSLVKDFCLVSTIVTSILYTNIIPITRYLISYHLYKCPLSIYESCYASI